MKNEYGWGARLRDPGKFVASLPHLTRSHPLLSSKPSTQTPGKRCPSLRLLRALHIVAWDGSSRGGGIGSPLLWNGRTYQGAHTPVVSVEQFERVQKLLKRAEKPRPRTRSFAFTGMIRCGECGFLVTGEEKVNKYGSEYTYYHCTKRRMDYRCRQPYVSKRCLETQIEHFLRGLTLPARLHNWAVKYASSSHGAEQQAIKERKQTLQQAQERTKTSFDNLTSLRVRDLIGDEEFLRERRKLEFDQLRLRQQLEDGSNAIPAFELLETLISFRNKALDWFRNGDEDAKRMIFEIVVRTRC